MWIRLRTRCGCERLIDIAAAIVPNHYIMPLEPGFISMGEQLLLTENQVRKFYNTHRRDEAGDLIFMEE